MSEEVDDIPDGPLLTEAEAAKDLKVSRSFLAKASMNGTGPEFINAVQPFATRRARSRSTKQTRTSTSQYPKRVSNGPGFPKPSRRPGRRRKEPRPQPPRPA
jgi:hypothetical protein